MFFESLLKHLARKICKEEGDQAAEFIVSFFNSLFSLLKRRNCYREGLEASMVLGFLKDLYEFPWNKRDEKIPLFTYFVQVNVGLLIMHAKNNEETKIKLKELLPIMSEHFIFDAFNLEQIRQDIQTKHFPVEEFWSIFTKELICNLEYIEFEVFSKLGYKISINDSGIIEILRSLLAEMSNSYAVISDLYSFLLEVTQEKAELSPFVLEIKKLREELAFKEVCKQLEMYVKDLTNYPEFSAFFKNTVCRQPQDASNILEQINQGKINDLSSILKELKGIWIISNNDRLLDIKRFLEELCPAEVKYTLGEPHL